MNDPASFFEAIRRGERAQVDQMLRANHALLEAQTPDGLSPVLVAVYHQEAEIATYLADRKVMLTIFEACATGRITHVIRLLAREPALVASYSSDGFQPLGLAAFFGHEEVVQYLLAAGAPVNAPSTNPMKVMPLHSAAAGRHTEIARLLLAAGADPNTRQAGGFSALHSAAQNGQVEMVQLLLFHGADLQIRNDLGQTALDLAHAQGHEQAAELLRSGITKRFRAARRPGSGK